MENDELARLEEDLRSLFASLGLSWVLPEVDLGIADGHQEERVVSRRRTEQDLTYSVPDGWAEESSAETPRRREKPVIVVRPMTPADRVRQLLTALRVVLVETPREETATLYNLGSDGREVTVSFVGESPRDVDEQQTTALRANRVPSELLEELRSKLDELLAAVDG